VQAQPGLAANGILAPASLVELAVQRLRSEILSGALVPGERLIEEQLTRRFGTSRAPLREALQVLGQQGLVEHLPRRGVRVTELVPQDVDELFSLRDVLERFAVQIAPPVPDPPALPGQASATPPRAAEPAAAVASTATPIWVFFMKISSP